jgi:Membrane domain of glycerophosphoryl diester phosphodiesterase
MIRFDSSKAWNEASQSVAANRDVLLALAGVFLVLPMFTLLAFLPPPVPPAGATPQKLFEVVGEYYSGAWPAYVAASLVSSVGSLAMLALLTDRSRPTVGQAIKLGAMGTPSVIAAQILLGMGLTLAALVPVALAAASPVLALLAGLALLAAAVWVMIRTALTSPAVMVDRLRNPVAALQRSWQLTQGNAVRLLAFFVLVGIAFLVSIWIAEMVIGLALTWSLPGDAGAIAKTLVSAIFQAVMSVYFIAIMASSHRQLAGSDADSQVQVFE